MSEVGPGGKYQNQDPNSQYSDFKADYKVIMRKIFCLGKGALSTVSFQNLNFSGLILSKHKETGSSGGHGLWLPLDNQMLF